MRAVLVYAVLLCLAPIPAWAKSPPVTVEGIPSVTDGDTIKIGKDRVRFQGIDAPEKKQVCRNDTQAIKCGLEASAQLKKLIGGRNVICHTEGKDRYQRYIGECFVGNVSLNQKMVQTGWAMAYRAYSQKYVADEEAAARQKLGIWQYEFIPPWTYRSQQRH